MSAAFLERHMDSLPTSQAPTHAHSLSRVGMAAAFVYLANAMFYARGLQVYSRTQKELIAWGCVLPLLYLFWKGYQTVDHAVETPELRRIIIRFALLLAFLAAITFPFHSTDVFGYINRGWQQVHYGQNPFVYFIGDIKGWEQDPMIWKHWIYNPSPYGFLFALLCRALVKIGNGHWWLTLALFKVVNLVAYTLTACLIWFGAKRLGHTKPIVALYCFLWNPLILMHHLANGHNDVLTGSLIALSMYLAIIGAGLWIIPALVAATFLKYATLPLLPLAFIFIVKRNGWKVALLSCVIGAVIAVLCSAPYLQDWRSFRLTDIKDNATLIDNSLHSLLIHIFENIARLLPRLAPLHGAVDSVIKLLIRLGFVVFFLAQFRIPKDFTARVFIEKTAFILFALICVATSKFNAWYLAMLLPSALLLTEKHWLRRLVVLITAAELLSLTFFKQAYMLNYFAMILVPCWIVYRQERKKRALAGSGGESPAAAPST
jgi:hypothetical protein